MKLSLQVVEAGGVEDIDNFLAIYLKMNEARNIAINEGVTRGSFHGLYKLFNETNIGKFLVVKAEDKAVIGGIIVLFQNGTARYYKGAADPAVRNIPVLHLAIWEAIRISKARGQTLFDFWGYNHFVKEGEQIFNINRFKKGFGGQYLFFPKRMYFVFKPLSRMIFDRVRSIYKRIKTKEPNK